jgi:site-specific DNA-cytosine methylase
MLIFDFFAGTGSSTKAFEDNGHTVIRIELDKQFEAHERDIRSLTSQYLLDKYGQPDFIWASPPCTTFSVASIGKHWNVDKTPKTDEARIGLELVRHTIKLINELNPKHWLLENPRGMLRKQSIMANLPRQTVTYCQYGDFRMKPTDLFGKVGNWKARAACKNGDTCHQSAPRGSRNGTQSIKGAKNRSVIPYELSKEIYEFTLE